METCRKIEARQAEGKTELIEVNWGYLLTEVHLAPI